MLSDFMTECYIYVLNQHSVLYYLVYCRTEVVGYNGCVCISALFVQKYFF